MELQRRYNDQAKYLKTLSNKLALLEDQLKQMEYSDTVAGNCKQCLGKSLNLCGQCFAYRWLHRYKKSTQWGIGAYPKAF